jgi:hypothetical protein
MRRLVPVLVGMLCLVSCGEDRGAIERIYEDGVEVVLNGSEPYGLQSGMSDLSLEREYAIDTELEELSEIGLTGIENFDVDDEGFLYLIQWHVEGDHIFKFTPDCRFLRSFCRRGQGPGEIEWGGTVMLDKDGNLIAKDPSKIKFTVFSRDGEYLRQVRMPRHMGIIFHFQSGRYLVSWQDQEPLTMTNHVALCDPDFTVLEDFASTSFGNLLNADSYVVGGYSLLSGADEENLYVGNADWGYEIRVFDNDGVLKRKIRKDYEPVPIEESFKESYLGRFPPDDPFKKKIRFAENWPPFRHLFVGDGGYLYVMTWEPGDKPREFMYDIYNPEGVFVARASLGNGDQRSVFPAKVKGGKLYAIEEKDSGYRELAVYRMIWR